MLNVVIGLIFILLLLSLLATTVMELISGLLSFRGRHLERVLRNMLATDSDELLEKFKENPFYKQLAGKFLGKRTPPSYLSSANFRSILEKILGGKEQLEAKIGEIKDENLREILNQFVEEAEGNLEDLRNRIEQWYDDVMDRASGWYKRNIQKVLILVGIGIAVIFNADTISIYNRLSKDPKARLEVATLAQEFVQSDSLQTVSASEETIKEIREEIDYLVNTEIENLKNPLGLGWDNFDVINADWYDWVQKILGWIVTALAISLGAPFWFDLLKKLVNVRSSGKVPPPSSGK